MATIKYSDIEIQTAKNLLKEGYKWIARDESGLLAFHSKPSNRCSLWLYGYYFCEFVPIFLNISIKDSEPVSLEAIVHPQILDDAEREYLSAVIKPFRDRVRHIKKVRFISDESEYQYVVIILRDVSYNLALPIFKEGTMYKGMKLGHKYSLEELGL